MNPLNLQLVSEMWVVLIRMVPSDFSAGVSSSFSSALTVKCFGSLFFLVSGINSLFFLVSGINSPREN